MPLKYLFLYDQKRMVHLGSCFAFYVVSKYPANMGAAA